MNQNHQRSIDFGSNRRPRGSYEEDIDDEPLYDPVAPCNVDYEVHDFDANPRDEANRRLAFRREDYRQQDIIYDGSSDEVLYHFSKVSFVTYFSLFLTDTIFVSIINFIQTK